MKSICVYCGSADHVHPDYLLAARQMGETLARRGLTLIYGGGRTGLMGALADGVLESGGQVIGVIVESMNTPALAHPGVTRMEVTPLIQQRKARMYKLADAYIALPGGYGTLDELFETLTWAQIGVHAKPVGLLNVGGYFDPLLAMLDRAEKEGFVFPEHRKSLLCASDPGALLDAMKNHEPPVEAVKRWMRQG
ncbi:MAG: TIGR00730 family Rossman fold protein [Anaerolineales bacterium]|nr:TIGR00730 family Rossman fold protein [Anaerolineales bacterium]